MEHRLYTTNSDFSQRPKSANQDERESEKERGREREKERESVCICVQIDNIITIMSGFMSTVCSYMSNYHKKGITNNTFSEELSQATFHSKLQY